MSKESKERIVGYIDIGESEGANLLLDGRKVEGDANPEGFFVGPTIFDNVTPEMKIASEEIFGPVVGVIRADDLEGALDVIRSSGFGNAATIYTESGKLAREFRYRAPVGKRRHQRRRRRSYGLLPIRRSGIVLLWVPSWPGPRRGRLLHRPQGGNHALAVNHAFLTCLYSAF